MPTVASVAARLVREGDACTLRRLTSTTTYTDVSVRAFVRGYSPAELVGALRQGDREARISDAEIAAASWPGPPRQGDKLIVSGRVCNVEAVETRRLRGATAMHVLTVRG